LLKLQRSGKIGTFAPVKGQEAAQIGAAAAIRDNDWLVPAFRETAAAVWRGTPLTSLILYNGGYNEGGHVETGARDLPIAIPVASQLPHAAGIAYAAQLMKTDEVVLTFFGDGATSEGDFHEAANFAAVLELPVVFVCQNNQWAISVPRKRQTKSRTLAQKAFAYGMPGVVVDGNDVLAVHRAAADAVERARSGKGPSLVECETYRLEVHTTADDPTRYRDENEVEEWAARDPLDRLHTLLSATGALKDSDYEDLEQKLDDEIDTAWHRAENRMAELDDPLALFEHVYAEMPPGLARQREEAKQRFTHGDDDG
jgi:pyruvate dehydrogenase E1 component alpha subunit